ncbi:hypothetical protein NM208_g6062 [Fusarium decemcellulare]|uniref:Uncharacterized protein n=1 Tax=Fusarium decemcellulare TaxID=57161 RepID=A0ACC1SEQ2_9HYPO|nr:hypothetical protein NM208_g6062 [Fusarium decemcellulare]
MSVANIAREGVESLSSFAEAHDNPTGAIAGATARVSDTDKNARFENAPYFNPLPVANTSSSVEYTAVDPRGTGNNTQGPYADYFTELAKFKGEMSSRIDVIEKKNQMLVDKWMGEFGLTELDDEAPGQVSARTRSSSSSGHKAAQKRPNSSVSLSTVKLVICELQSGNRIAMRSVREYYNDGIAKLSQPPVTVVSTQPRGAGQETSSSAVNVSTETEADSTIPNIRLPEANPSQPPTPSETQNSFTLTLEDMGKNMTLQLQKITRANNFKGLINFHDPTGHLNVPWETLRAKYQKRRRTNTDVTAVSYTRCKGGDGDPLGEAGDGWSFLRVDESSDAFKSPEHPGDIARPSDDQAIEYLNNIMDHSPGEPCSYYVGPALDPRFNKLLDSGKQLTDPGVDTGSLVWPMGSSSPALVKPQETGRGGHWPQDSLFGSQAAGCDPTGRVPHGRQLLPIPGHFYQLPTPGRASVSQWRHLLITPLEGPPANKTSKGGTVSSRQPQTRSKTCLKAAFRWIRRCDPNCKIPAFSSNHTPQENIFKLAAAIWSRPAISQFVDLVQAWRHRGSMVQGEPEGEETEEQLITRRLRNIAAAKFKANLGKLQVRVAEFHLAMDLAKHRKDEGRQRSSTALCKSIVKRLNWKYTTFETHRDNGNKWLALCRKGTDPETYQPGLLCFIFFEKVKPFCLSHTDYRNPGVIADPMSFNKLLNAPYTEAICKAAEVFLAALEGSRPVHFQFEAEESSIDWNEIEETEIKRLPCQVEDHQVDSGETSGDSELTDLNSMVLDEFSDEEFVDVVGEVDGDQQVDETDGVIEEDHGDDEMDEDED